MRIMLSRIKRGFTLIELLIAITLMAVLAGLSWRGLDSLMRSRDITQAQVDKTAVLQTVLAQWQADLNAVQPVPSIADAGIPDWELSSGFVAVAPAATPAHRSGQKRRTPPPPRHSCPAVATAW